MPPWICVNIWKLMLSNPLWKWADISAHFHSMLWEKKIILHIVVQQQSFSRVQNVDGLFSCRNREALHGHLEANRHTVMFQIFIYTTWQGRIGIWVYQEFPQWASASVGRWQNIMLHDFGVSALAHLLSLCHDASNWTHQIPSPPQSFHQFIHTLTHQF